MVTSIEEIEANWLQALVVEDIGVVHTFHGRYFVTLDGVL